jgi:hypothetical protein
MSTALGALERLRLEIIHSDERVAEPDYVERIDYRLSNDGVHVFFFGSASGTAYASFLAALAMEPIASSLCSVVIDGFDEGANGTRNWDVSPLADSAAKFPNLRHLRIQGGADTDHNRTIVARVYDEDGVIGKIAAKATGLETLVCPSAPSANFFNVPLNNLRYLAVDAGYDTNDFIGNLSKSRNTPNLRSLTWGEYSETYMDDWKDRTTPFQSLVDLIKSPAFDAIKVFCLKNPTCSDEQLMELGALRPEMQFKVVRTSSAYVRQKRT